MKKSHSEKALINAGSGLAVKLLDLLIKFILKTIFIYTLGIQYTGVSTLFTDIMSILALAELGIGHAITFALYKPLKENDEPRIAALMHFYKQAYRVIAGLILLGGAVCIPFLSVIVKGAPDIRENIAVIFSLYVINSASSYLLVYKSTLLTASERRYIISKVTIICSIARVAIECVLLLIFKQFLLFLVVEILGSLTRNLIISRKADKLYPMITKPHNERLTRDESRKLFANIGALSLYRVCTTILNSTDSIVISAASSLGVSSVGYLGNYRMLVHTIDTIIMQLFINITPSLGTMAVGATKERKYSVYAAMDFMAFWGSCVCCTCLICLLTPFVTTIWLGEKYVLSSDIIVILVLNLYIGTMVRPANTVRNANGLFTQGYYRPLIMAAMNIGLDIWFVRFLGVAGVLLATSISRITTQLWYDPYLAYKLVFERPFSEYIKRFGGYTVLVAGSCALSYYLCSLIGAGGNPYLRFLPKLLISLIIPNLLVFAFFRKSPVMIDVLTRVRGMAKHLMKRLRGKKRPSA